MKTNKSTKNIKKTIESLSLEHILTENVWGLLSIRHYDPGEQIIEGESSVINLYLLYEGQAQIMPSSKEGRLVSMGFITPIDIIGDLEYFSNDDYYHDVIALTACSVLVLPVVYIDTHFAENSAFYKFLCENLAGKMKKTSLLFSRTLLYPVKNRLAMYLHDLSQFNNSNHLDISFKQTAELMGITPRHFRRLLSEFEEEGILKRNKRSLLILSMEQLKLYLE